jgi:hypothetical protein
MSLFQNECEHLALPFANECEAVREVVGVDFLVWGCYEEVV